MEMDRAAIFRQLVENQLYFPDEWSFQTVFYRTPYSYCCCPCAFEHEFIDYITDSGEINHEIFERILQNIIDGKCPHVNNASAEHISKTAVHSIHIKAAIWSVEFLEQYLRDTHDNRKTRIFDLNTYVIATLKNTFKEPGKIPFLADKYLPVDTWSSKILSGRRSEEDKQILKLEWLSLFEACIRRKIDSLVCSIVNNLPFPTDQSDVAKAYELIFKHGCGYSQIEACILEKEKNPQKRMRESYNRIYPFEYISCAEPAIVWNHPQNLDKILTSLNLTHGDLTAEFDCALVETCFVLQRSACSTVLTKHNISMNTENVSVSDQLKRLLQLLEYYPHTRKEITVALKQIPDVQKVISSRFSDEDEFYVNDHLIQTQLQSYVYFNDDIDPEVVRVMLEVGADLDDMDDYNETLLQHLLENGRKYIPCFRKLLELLLYENPCCSKNSDAVRLGLKIDDEMNGLWTPLLKLIAGEYHMDMKEHGFFRHEDSECFALNFTAPLLIECGFPVSSTMLERALNKSSEQLSGKGKGRGRGGFAASRELHPAEKLYFETCLDTPRSLTKCCRDTLRKHFKRREIHEFVASVGLPEVLQDFILLKSVLRTI